MNLMKKLLLGFFSVILLLVIVTGITYFQFHSIDNSYDTTIEQNTEKVQLITYSIMENYKAQVALRSYSLTGDAKELENYNQARKGFDKNVEDLRAITDTEQASKVIDNFVAGEEAYHLVSEKIIAAKRQNDIEEVTQLMEIEGSEERENIEALARELLFLQQDHFQAEKNELSQETNRTTNLVLVISIFAIIVGIVVAIWISRDISRRVKVVSNAAEEIAEGNLSIEEIKIKSKDEVGQLAQSFNKMSENLRDIINQVGQTSETVAASSEELLASTEETTAATNQVAASITEVANNVETQSKNTEESAEGINQITTGIVRIAENASTVASSSAETIKQANIGSNNIQNVVAQMNTISQANTETNEVIQELEKRSSDIGKIIEVITDISDQTNLLALNAAIESARAGEHGKGFAVVADEVRKLAEQSRNSANQIAEIIQFIQTDTSRAAELMETGTNEVTNGLSLVQETSQTFDAILTSIENANAQIQELSAVSEEISVSVEQVNTSINEVSELAKVSSDSAGEIAAVTEEQLASTEEVSHAATSLANMAEELRALVNRFKI